MTPLSKIKLQPPAFEWVAQVSKARPGPPTQYLSAPFSSSLFLSRTDGFDRLKITSNDIFRPKSAYTWEGFSQWGLVSRVCLGCLCQAAPAEIGDYLTHSANSVNEANIASKRPAADKLREERTRSGSIPATHQNKS